MKKKQKQSQLYICIHEQCFFETGVQKVPLPQLHLCKKFEFRVFLDLEYVTKFW